MKMIRQKAVWLASSLALLLALGACNRADDGSLSPRADSSVNQPSRAGAQADANDTTAGVGSSTGDAAPDTRAMGAMAGKVDDASITAQVNAGLAKDKELSALKIDVDTRDGVVTLSGPAPSATARAHAADIARKVKGVNSVNNQLTIKAS